LRALALCPALTDAGAAISSTEAGLLAKQLSPEGDLENGAFLHLSRPSSRGAIRWLEPPPPPVRIVAPAAGASTAVASAVSPPAAASPSANDAVALKLARTFRSALGLAPDSDVSACAIDSVPRWDSLGHLKLMMEVEQALGVRLPAEALSRIQSYRDLERAVRAVLPARA
jgi:acyl carrier protein